MVLVILERGKNWRGRIPLENTKRKIYISFIEKCNRKFYQSFSRIPLENWLNELLLL
jgi:hypothetical protein